MTSSDPRTETLNALTLAIANAQALLEQLKAPVLTSEGWAAVRANGCAPSAELQERFSPRHGCAWNAKEARDLVGKWLQFTSVETLARIHRRTEGGVRSELQRLLNSANAEVLLDEICGAPSTAQPADGAADQH